MRHHWSKMLTCKKSRGVCLKSGVLILLAASLAFLYLCHDRYVRTDIDRYLDDCTKLRNVPHIAVYEREYSVDNLTSFKYYKDALKTLASSTKSIMLAFFDNGALDIALNLYETSFQKYSIKHFLFLSSSDGACAAVQQEGAPCLVYAQDSASEKHSVYMSKDFIRKMNIRTYMILEALKLGYNVLHTDVDMIFFTDPLPYVETHCPIESCDIAPLWDSIVHNAGFVFVRSTKPGITVYEKMKHFAETTKIDDQWAMNEVVKKGNEFNLRLLNIPEKQFQSGRKYFEDGNRTVAEHAPCDECIVVHNNWMVSVEAKVYRFKEMHQWMYDGPNKYYSDPYRKYITYNNPQLDLDTSWEAEKEALINALIFGYLLNRTVILPRFHTKGQPDTLLSHARILVFDSFFGDCYRESTFLSHPKVPLSVKQSVSPLITIQTTIKKSKTPAHHFIPNDVHIGATAEEILEWFRRRTESVLVFSSLYGAFSHNTQRDLVNRCYKAIQPATYRQYL